MSATKKVSSTVQQDRRDYYAKLVVLAFGFITVLFIARQLFDDEFSLVVKWWLVLIASGIAFMPLSMLVLRRFKDSGWICSKVIGIAVSGWFMWFLASVKVMKFTEFPAGFHSFSALLQM